MFYLISFISIIVQMQEGKIYSLKLNIKSIISKNLRKETAYAIKITKQTEKQILGPFKITDVGEFVVNQKVQFKIPSGQLKRDSKCVIQILQWNSKELATQQGRYEFSIMNYKNYSKKSCKIMCGEKIVGMMDINFNISSFQAENVIKRYSQSSQSRKDTPKKSVKLSEQSISIVKQEAPIIRVKAPIQQIKLICPIQPTSQKQPKSMFNAFQNSGIIIQTKKDVNSEVKRTDKNIISSMGELFEKKSKQNEDMTLKVPTNDVLNKSMRQSINRSQKDSRYCKQIQQNLDHLSALDQQANRLSFSRSPLKEQTAEFSIFDTLHRMKSKFQKIHEKQEILNEDNELIDEQNDNFQDKQLESPLYSHINQLKSIHSENAPQQHNQLGKSTVLDLQVNSHIALSRKTIYTDCNIIKVIDYCFEPKKKDLKINNSFNLKISRIQPCVNEQAKYKKRYMLAKMKDVSQFNIERQQIENKAFISQTNMNIQIQQQSLDKASYIKLNKISHLTQAADSLKKRNYFLIKANEELKIGKKIAQHKLQISKKILDQKEDLLDHQFQNLTAQMKKISQNLNFKNKQSIQREQKIKSLKTLIETYARDINSLKNDLKKSYSTIKDLKSLLANKDQAESSQLKKQEIDPIKETKNMRELFTKLEEKSNPFTEFLASQKRGNSVGNKSVSEDRKIRKFSSIDNTVNFEQNGDRSYDKVFRKFSHSKNISLNSFESQQLSQNTRPAISIDKVFEQLNGLFAGDPKTRLLKNL